MSALVVYESMYGNTQQIAEAVAEGLRTRTEVTIAEVSTAPSLLSAGIDLIVVGAPTHAHSLSRAQTRASAAEGATAGLVSPANGVREWLGSLAEPYHRIAAASFDTRFRRARWLTGSAAKTVSRRLSRIGFEAMPPESFYVDAAHGPLEIGEVSRARAWGESLPTRAGMAAGELRR